MASQAEIVKLIKQILANIGHDKDSLVCRKKSPFHQNEAQVLLENLSVIISDLQFDLECTRRELFEAKLLLEK